MDVLYQIVTKDIRAYAADIVACDELCAKIIDNGCIPKVRRIKRSQVPMCDLELVNGLK